MKKMNVVELVKHIRISLGMTQDEFSKHLDVKRSAICNWETGRRAPRLRHLKSMTLLAKQNSIDVKIHDFLE